ncbi:trigger factor [Dokdonella koreensis]|uniref:Trigger factor n=1 Tax=Dokdonella koreensis DS-123 TaxID=1300342 RepID=A0A167GYB6_9GAMM|nr:trigger factor [Dokdonella koreensis]ANB18156.1 Cell division trigger factor [Dokdonella koreensis DS-123]
MQVSVENVGKLGRKLVVRLPADRLEDTVRDRIQEMTRSARLKGFRPGKVPQKVIEQRFGAQLRNEVLSDLIGSSFQEAVAKENLRPAVQPAISTTGRPDNGQIEYTAEFEVVPDIGPIDVSALEIARTTAEVTDTDIDEMIETLRQQRRTWAPVERAAETGDMALFEFSAEGEGFRHPESGSDRIGTIIGSNALPAALESALVGQTVGGDFEVEVTFPAEFRESALAGKTAKVKAHVVRLQAPQVPEIDEAFIAAFGVREGGLERFREDVRANLQRELGGVLMNRLKAATIDKLIAAHADLELPQSMVEGEARILARQARVPDDQSAEAFLPAAKRRVSAGLLLAEVARQNQISVEPQRVREALATIASTYEEPQQVVELYNRDPQLMNGLHSRVLEDQVVEWIADRAKVSEQALSFNEVMRPGA